MPEGLPLLMDRAYEGNETRQLVLDLGMIPVVPPKSNRLHPWEYDRALYKKRNEIERLFRRLKGFRRIFSRFEKLNVVFLAFLSFALIVGYGLRPSRRHPGHDWWGLRWRSPGSRAEGFCTCQGLRRRGAGSCLAMTTLTILPSVGRKTSAPRTCLTPLNT